MKTYAREDIEAMIQAASSLELELVWIKRIMENQTHDEERAETTKYHNDVGLNGSDAHFITSVYHQTQNGKHLTQRQEDRVRRTLPKYWKQYVVMMNSAACSSSKATKHTERSAEKQVMEDSAREPCEVCGTNSYILVRAHRIEDEISHWDALCNSCGTEVEILND